MECTDLIVDGLSRVNDTLLDLLDGLSEQQLAFRPTETANSIGWIAWHLTRVQDDHVSELAGRPQAWLTDGWYERFGRSQDGSDTGYGHSASEVGAFRVPDAQVLTDYHSAVYRRSLEYLRRVDNEDFDRVIDTRWDPPVTVGVRLVSVVDDCAQHVGQVGYLRGILP